MSELYRNTTDCRYLDARVEVNHLLLCIVGIVFTFIGLCL